ncbi:hypothetical protein D0T84_12375 [Dysgonomonas sp. 521]|uniref:hypothetical protein n=1 Tax=Dysgonomonas sp. 521 TaxID=2302932 RepID=UPI0013D00ECD|nr:hypothetical protein [Dysgonomonas sp. 521]NDV95704.1 hypothetical protein [Dysgonomonas sp. 521]
MNTQFKLTGQTNIITYSSDGSLIIISDYDGGFKIYDVKKEKLIFKTKIKGKKSDIIIHYHDISCDNRFAAFSCDFKVFIVDIAKKEIIKEISYSKEIERQATSPFCFFRTSAKIAIPNGGELIIYDIETENSIRIKLPSGAGWTDCLATNANDTIIAYKSNNDELRDKVYIYDLADGKLLNTVKVPYPIGYRQEYICRDIRFVDEKTFVILRKAFGISHFDADSGKEVQTITWDTMGFRTVHAFWESAILDDCRYILFYKETNTANDPDEWHVDPEEVELILYDSGEKKIVSVKKTGMCPASFYVPDKRLAYVKKVYDENYKISRFLVTENL